MDTKGSLAPARAGDAAGIGEAAVELTAELVSLNTVNPGLEPGAPGEAAAVELLRCRLAGGGFETQVVASAATGRPSLLAVHHGSGGGRSLLLNGHLDTVAAGAMSEPFTPRVDGERMTGRGTCDMKAGVAGLVVAAEHAAAAGTRGDIVLALVADEENDSLGTEAVLRALRSTRGARLPDACLVGEPTWLELAAAHRGYAVVEVALLGRAAHSSCPEQGVNAVTHLGRLLAAVEAEDEAVRGRSAHPVVGSGSLMATVARGGEAPFSLAAAAYAVIERRTVPGERAAEALTEVEAVLERLRAQDPGFDATATLQLAREAWELAPRGPSTELAGLVTQALSAQGRPQPGMVGAPYWMESALWEEAGIPTVVCGPAGGGLHADDEWVDLGQVRAYAAAMTQVVVEFCGGTGIGAGAEASR
jgi:acetylornithine deacetylase